MKTGRKEALYHDDPAVASQVEAEQEKVQQEKTERANNRAAASRRELEVMQEQLGPGPFFLWLAKNRNASMDGKRSA